MKRQATVLLGLILALLIAGRSMACGGCSPKMLHSDDPADRALAIEEFRQIGPYGLNLLLKYRDTLLKNGEEPKSAKMVLLNDAIDQVGGAKYCTASRLYWFTDLE